MKETLGKPLASSLTLSFLFANEDKNLCPPPTTEPSVTVWIPLNNGYEKALETVWD